MCHYENKSVDFVLPWVDPSDPCWQANFAKYEDLGNGDTRQSRFRDWNNLHYWFRSIEKFAPWVNRIHFLTCGHTPHWLNCNHRKISIVRHAEYIPEIYLPTFNTRTIELNVHRINDLSENYVYFNDDMFILKPIEQDFFFREGVPCDEPAMKILTHGSYDHTLLENIAIINTLAPNKWPTLLASPKKWYHPKYRLHAITNFILSFATRYYPGFANFHLPQPLRKSTLINMWEIAQAEMRASCKPRFREYSTVNHYLQRYWELVNNNFFPVSMRKRGKYFDVSKETANEISSFIRNQEQPMICINDNDDLVSFKESRDLISNAFAEILVEKSTFEI